MGKSYTKITVACQSSIADALQSAGNWPEGIQGKSPTKLTYIGGKLAVAWHLPHATEDQVLEVIRAYKQLKNSLEIDRSSAPTYATVGAYTDFLEETADRPILHRSEELVYTHCSGEYPGAQVAVPSRNMRSIHDHTNQLQIGSVCILKFVNECILFLDKPTWLTLKLMGLLVNAEEYWLTDVPVIQLNYGADMIMQTSAWRQLRQAILPALLELPAGGYKLYFLTTTNTAVWSFGELTDYPVQVLRTVYHLGQPTQCHLPEVQHTDLGSLLAQVVDCYDTPF